MKNQYVADLGDYGKYGLLRFLTRKGIRIGVNWYLTDDDDTKDGKFTDYLNNTKENGDKQYDDELFYALQPIAAKGKGMKCVQDIESRGIIPGAVFYSDVLISESKEREAWHERALEQLRSDSIDLIFADPDNGTWCEHRKLPQKTGKKYARIEELRQYYDEGKDIVYYCHKARRKAEDWQAKMHEFNTDGHNAKIIVLTYHRGTQRSYIFAIHPENYSAYNAMLEEFIKSAWGSLSIKGKKPPFSRESL